MRLLLISNSTMAGEPYLDYPKYEIKFFLGEGLKNIVFIPYAGVSMTDDAYTGKVNERFNEIGLDVTSIRKFDDPVKSIEQADAIVVGGGNTFELANQLQRNNLIEPIRKKVQGGTPYVGWSAGSNMACPQIITTNDMPIVQPPSFKVLNLIPFQINPHYLDANPDGHAGETREERIAECMILNQDIYIIGLREGSILRYEDGKLNLWGKNSLRIFKYGHEPYEVESGSDLSFLIKNIQEQTD